MKAEAWPKRLEVLRYLGRREAPDPRAASARKRGPRKLRASRNAGWFQVVVAGGRQDLGP